MDELFDSLYKKALHYLSFRQRSEKEMREFLIGKKASEEMLEKLVELLKEQRLIDDEVFARAWLEQRATHLKRSMRILRYELQQKGIATEIIEKLTSGEESVVSDVEQVKKLIDKLARQYKALPERELKQKIGNNLARRGFGWETISKSLKDYFNKE